MIESKIDELIQAITLNTAALNAVLAKAAGASLPGNPMPADQPAAAPKAAKAKAKAEAPAPEPTPEPADEDPIPFTEPEATAEPAPFNRDALIEEITAAVKDLYRNAGTAIAAKKEAFEALRNEFGCKTVKDLDDEKLVAILPRVKAL